MAPPRPNGHKIDYVSFILVKFKFRKSSKSLYWVKSYSNFGERGDYTYTHIRIRILDTIQQSSKTVSRLYVIYKKWTLIWANKCMTYLPQISNLKNIYVYDLSVCQSLICQIKLWGQSLRSHPIFKECHSTIQSTIPGNTINTKYFCTLYQLQCKRLFIGKFYLVICQNLSGSNE